MPSTALPARVVGSAHDPLNPIEEEGEREDVWTLYSIHHRSSINQSEQQQQQSTGDRLTDQNDTLYTWPCNDNGNTGPE